MSRPLAVATVIWVGIATGRWRRPAPSTAIWDADASADATPAPDAAPAHVVIEAEAPSTETVEAVSSRSADVARAASMMARARWGQPATVPEGVHLAADVVAPKLQFGPMVFNTPAAFTVAAPRLQFGPMAFSTPTLLPQSVAPRPFPTRPETEFVPVRIDVDIDGLRSKLTGIAMGWLGADEAAPVAEAIAATPPGVEDFVLTIASISEMEALGRNNPVVRAMTREMHYYAAEVLCGV